MVGFVWRWLEINSPEAWLLSSPPEPASVWSLDPTLFFEPLTSTTNTFWNLNPAGTADKVSRGVGENPVGHGDQNRPVHQRQAEREREQQVIKKKK